MHIDPFAVFLALATTAVGAMIGAIAAEGWKARLLWLMAAGFGIASVAFWFRPASLTEGQIWNYFLAMLPLIVVVFVVATRTPPASRPVIQPVKEEAPDLTRTSEAPDMMLAGVLQQISQSVWAETNKATPAGILVELRDKLAAHALTAFGRWEESAVNAPIPWKQWAGLKIDPERHTAVNSAGEVVYHDLQFDSAYVTGTWPTSRSWMSI